MRIIIIESDVYKVTEKQYDTIMSKYKQIFDFPNGLYPCSSPCSPGDTMMSDFLNEMKSDFRHLGPVEFDFKL